MNIIIYNGKGISNLQKPLQKTLKLLLSHSYDVLLVSAKMIREDDWLSTTALFIMPGISVKINTVGGRDVPYCEELGSIGAGKIKEFVSGGGSYLGLCAGGYYACENIEFEMDRDDYRVFGKRYIKSHKDHCNSFEV